MIQMHNAEWKCRMERGPPAIQLFGDFWISRLNLAFVPHDFRQSPVPVVLARAVRR